MPTDRTGGKFRQIVKSFPHSAVLLPFTYFLLLTIGGGSEEHKHPTVCHPLDGWMTHLRMNLGVNQNNDIL